jgi:hypothetical protein
MTAFEKLSINFDLPNTSVNQPLSEEFSMRKLWNGEARRAAQTTIRKVVNESTNDWKTSVKFVITKNIKLAYFLFD